MHLFYLRLCHSRVQVFINKDIKAGFELLYKGQEQRDLTSVTKTQLCRKDPTPVLPAKGDSPQILHKAAAHLGLNLPSCSRSRVADVRLSIYL